MTPEKTNEAPSTDFDSPVPVSFLSVSGAFEIRLSWSGPSGTPSDQAEAWTPLAARNQSILAHGFQPVGHNVFDQLWSAAATLGGFTEAELPTFPRLAEPDLSKEDLRRDRPDS